METLKDIGECISCGRQDSQVYLNKDHFYPRCMMGPGKLKNVRVDHPFYQMVYQEYNLYKICGEEHDELDSQKCAAFLELAIEENSFKRGQRLKNIYRGDPVALVLFLMENYPITSNRRLFGRQVYGMTSTNTLFIEAAERLNGEFPEDLKIGYQRAAEVATDFNKKLASLHPPGFIINLPVSLA